MQEWRVRVGNGISEKVAVALDMIDWRCRTCYDCLLLSLHFRSSPIWIILKSWIGDRAELTTEEVSCKMGVLEKKLVANVSCFPDFIKWSNNFGSATFTWLCHSSRHKANPYLDKTPRKQSPPLNFSRAGSIFIPHVASTLPRRHGVWRHTIGTLCGVKTWSPQITSPDPPR